MSSLYSGSVEMIKKKVIEQVVNRTRRRIKDLKVEVQGNSVIIRGKADSYHVKQLALRGVREAHPDGSVVLEIEVG